MKSTGTAIQLIAVHLGLATSVAVVGLATARVRTALATPASKILSALLWLSLLCASAPQTFAQGGIPLWTNRYNGAANFGDAGDTGQTRHK